MALRERGGDGGQPQGISQDQAEEQLVQMDAQGSQERTQDLGGSAPPAREPLDPSRLQMLQDAVGEAVEKLGGGQLAEIPMQPVAEAVEAIPPDTFAPVMALVGFAQQRGLDQFDVDLDTLATSNDGVGELAATISQMANDPEVQKAVREPGPARQEQQPEAAEQPADQGGDDERLRKLIPRS